MSLKDQISEDMKTAMRAKDSLRLGAIRLLLSAIKQREVDERITLDDAGITLIVDKMLKQRKDSISQFQAAGRDDLAAQEQAEMAVLIAYMPAQLSDAEVADAVQEVVVELGASSQQDLGRVMAALRTRLAGKADMTAVAALAKAALANK
jgi:uncharacterized protein